MTLNPLRHTQIPHWISNDPGCHKTVFFITLGLIYLKCIYDVSFEQVRRIQGFSQARCLHLGVSQAIQRRSGKCIRWPLLIHRKIHPEIMHVLRTGFQVKVLFLIFDMPNETSDISDVDDLQESRRAKFVLIQYNGSSLGGIAKSRAGINKPGKSTWTLCPTYLGCREMISKHGIKHWYLPCMR
jgi:hypothetical protein